MSQIDLFVDDSEEELVVARRRKRTRKDIGEPPSEQDTIPEIHEWYISRVKPSDPYMDPRLGVAVVCGSVVKNHPKLPDGSEICTSALLYAIGEEPGKTFARTATRWYKLMNPSEAFVKFMEQESLGTSVWFSGGMHYNQATRFAK
jgi:hypothetical protein